MSHKNFSFVCLHNPHCIFLCRMLKAVLSAEICAFSYPVHLAGRFCRMLSEPEIILNVVKMRRNLFMIRAMLNDFHEDPYESSCRFSSVRSAASAIRLQERSARRSARPFSGASAVRCLHSSTASATVTLPSRFTSFLDGICCMHRCTGQKCPEHPRSADQ